MVSSMVYRGTTSIEPAVMVASRLCTTLRVPKGGFLGQALRFPEIGAYMARPTAQESVSTGLCTDSSFRNSTGRTTSASEPEGAGASLHHSEESIAEAEQPTVPRSTGSTRR